MTFNPRDLEPLVAVLVSKGAPILGGVIGGPVGAVVGGLLGQLATAFGLPADSPPDVVAQTIVEDPAATDKLSALQEKHQSELADFQAQIEANSDLAKLGDSFWQRFLIAGARPIMMWVCGPIVLIYQLVSNSLHLPTVDFDLFVACQVTFGSLAGFRTAEKWKGVDIKQFVPGAQPRLLAKKARV